MEKSVKQVRDIMQGLTMLANEPIATHVLNFRLSNAIAALEDVVVSLGKSETAILKEYSEVDAMGEPKRNDAGGPVWKEPAAYNEAHAVTALNAVLDETITLPSTVKPLSWSLLEKSVCVWTDKETGKRTESPLIVSVPVQLLLGDFIEGEPLMPAGIDPIPRP